MFHKASILNWFDLKKKNTLVNGDAKLYKNKTQYDVIVECCKVQKLIFHLNKQLNGYMYIEKEVIS